MAENNQTTQQTQTTQQQNQQTTQTQQPPVAPPQSPAIDYDKIQQMLDGTLAAKENTALKAYFKQQGLSQEEAEQAMTAFKTQKAKNQPDVNALQKQAQQAQALAQTREIENAAILQAMQLGIDAKTVPYVMRLADFSEVMGQDGKIKEESLKNALNKVLEDVPALKPTVEQTTGFKQVGATGGAGGGTGTDNDQLSKIFGV